ncbi:hypothetical protein GE09DRAFT_95581 [Coniochaeta sp. 2T2.1]|nr:hypothetical protein GE09DRAFT_95581 [Coniochaeta sp. 2T2.1]
MAAASVASGSSPLSGYDFHPDSTGDPEENQWTVLQQPGSSVSSNAGFSFSPASLPGSLSSWAMINRSGQQQHQPPLSSGPMSPLNLDLHPPSFPSSNYGDMHVSNAYSVTSAPAEGQFIPDGQTFMQSDSHFFDEEAFNAAFNPDMVANQQFALTEGDLLVDHSDFSDLIRSFGQESFEQQAALTHQNNLDIPQPYQSGPDVPPWNPANIQTGPETNLQIHLQAQAGGSPTLFEMEGPGFVSPSPPAPYQSPSVGTPESPLNIKLESGTSASTGSARKKSSSATSNPIAIPRTGGASGVQKKKKAPTSSSAPRSNASTSSSAGSTNKSQFLIVTPDSVNAHADRSNPYECFEAAASGSSSRPSQKGRKGPLLKETKENALQVRRKGACFCCHARKVRCDEERPCRNCTKLMCATPQVICWQFQDFLPVLFPTFIRSHFRKEEMTRFVADNIADFKVDGVEKPCVVELFSGAAWGATFRIKAKFFTARTEEVLQHWHMQVGRNGLDLHARGAPPIGLEMDGGGGLPGHQRDEIRKKAREYIANIIQEPKYAEQVTDSLRHTDLPRKILRHVQRYAQQSDQPMVKKALSIYAMHYVMTRHLCLTQQSLVSLRGTKLVPQDNPWVTPRVLNRQIKSVIDEMLMREMQTLFEAFSKSLKPKSRKEWAPCLAAFLVLCLFMEAVETASDTYVMSQNEIDLRRRKSPQWKRLEVLQRNRELENLPFKQFAHQFHQVYATHSRDANARSFNPLCDEGSLAAAELEGPALELVMHLRRLIVEPGDCRFSPPPLLVFCEDLSRPRANT